MNPVSIAVAILPLVRSLVADNGVEEDVKVALATIGAIRQCVSDVQAAKDPKSPGGTKITLDEGEHIALIFVESIAHATAPLMGISGGDVLSWGEDLAEKILDPLIQKLTGQTPPPVAATPPAPTPATPATPAPSAPTPAPSAPKPQGPPQG